MSEEIEEIEGKKDFRRQRIEQGFRHLNLWLKPRPYEMITKMRKAELLTQTSMIEKAIEEYFRNHHEPKGEQ